MSKITDPDQIVVGTELTINLAARTFTLNVAGNLVAKDGCTFQALYSKFIELWQTSTYNEYPFPFYPIDARSGQFQIGFDGRKYNTWAPASDATRQKIRDAGWAEYQATTPDAAGEDTVGGLTRVHVGIVTLGSVSSGAQLYYQRASGGTASDFTFTDAANEGIQVYGDASNGNFDTRTYFKVFCRVAAKTFSAATLPDVGETATGAYKIQLPVSNADDPKVAVADGSIGNSPYSGITITYYGTDQARTIGGVSRNFRTIVAGNGATLEQIYTKVQYLLRQSGDIDSGAGTVTGKTAASLMSFPGNGSALLTEQGVYIDNFDPNDTNRLTVTDQGGTQRTFPYTAAGNLTFNSYLVGGTYRVMFASSYGSGAGITVNDNSDTPLTGTITGSTMAFTFAYDSNVQGGRTAGTDADIVVVAGKPASAKMAVSTATISRATGQTVALTAEQDRAYTT